jgi:hypothetical protein
MAMAALIVGNSKGTAGADAMPCQPNTTYAFSFWAEGPIAEYGDIRGLSMAAMDFFDG